MTPPLKFDLEPRTRSFAQNVRLFVGKLRRSTLNTNDIEQVLRSSGSVGANYIEANEALSRRDFAHRIKISRKEAKESRFWLSLLLPEENSFLKRDCNKLIDEARQLELIFVAILKKVSAKPE